MLPPALEGFFPANALSGTDGLVVIPVIGRDILVARGSRELTVDREQADVMKFFCQQRLVLGQWNGVDCEVWDLAPECRSMDGFSVMELRSLLLSTTDDQFSLVSRAVQMLEWQKTHRYCGACGSPTESATTDHALKCLACDISVYPRISPCVIVVVRDGERCLLGRQVTWPEGRFSALAGFLEAGESAEQALHREVFEEAGVQISNLRYVGSQAWPFPGQLMLGFLADADTTEINVDGLEIAEAHWWHYKELPAILPPLSTMSGRLIARFVEEVTGT
ncbi:NAD(+) diphosphatase [Porticoccaceae bacterium]|nr:NAD(+) diphosphatase [Porticoccaceae bacterium]